MLTSSDVYVFGCKIRIYDIRVTHALYTQATTLGEDDARLAVPGRVWFLKPRRLKNGATLSRVLQGNIKEDMLWQLHDIMLTKSMLSHHRLDKYIKILDRV